MAGNASEAHTTPLGLPLSSSAEEVSRLGAAPSFGVEFSAIEAELAAIVAEHREEVAAVHPDHLDDAVNLLHYVALRRHDLHHLQRELTEHGLSSLGRCEAHVMASVLAIHALLEARPREIPPGVVGFAEGRAALDANTDALLGERPAHRVPRIMVTLDEQAAADYEFVRHLISCGMNIARINGAHDGPEHWGQMITNVERASTELGVRCRIAMDLPGPKLRTGPLEVGPQVLRLRPRRDLRGCPVAPVIFALCPTDNTTEQKVPGEVPMVPVDGGWLERRAAGEEIRLADTRGSQRSALVTEVRTGEGFVMAEIWDTTYLETGLELRCGTDATSVGPLPGREQYHVLRPGDALAFVAGDEPQVPWERGQPGMAEITCSLPALFSSVRAGERLLLDDGKFTGIIESVTGGRIVVRMRQAPVGGGRLRERKGINLPDSKLDIPLLGEADRALLEMATSRADMLSVSFLRTSEDIDALRAELGRLGAPALGLVLKIETQAAFTNLPAILLHAMRSPVIGMMIARGDLAVEVGYPRLAEMQEEILWLAEAAHLPVVWATDVLDKLASTGRPSPAAVTDAAMAQQAECVMLNKGPFIFEAIVELDDILRRMARHQRKKVPLLYPLGSWDRF